MFGFLGVDWIAIGAGFVVGAVVFYLVGHELGTIAGRNAIQLEQAQAAAATEKERVADDSRLQGLSDFDLCVESLRSRRMPVDDCEFLRGVP